MRLIKMAGLAALAALAAMAFVGAGSASADWLCEENVTDEGTCPIGQRVAEGAKILGLTTEAKPAVLLDESGGAAMTCHSTALGLFLGHEETAAEHDPVLGLIKTLSFSNCTGLCTTATEINMPALLLAQASSLDAWIEPHGNGLPGAILNNCTLGLVSNCHYNLESDKALLRIEGDNLIANGVPLVKGECTDPFGLAPEVSTWDATYLLTLDEPEGAPIYISLLP